MIIRQEQDSSPPSFGRDRGGKVPRTWTDDVRVSEPLREAAVDRAGKVGLPDKVKHFRLEQAMSEVVAGEEHDRDCEEDQGEELPGGERVQRAVLVHWQEPRWCPA